MLRTKKMGKILVKKKAKYKFKHKKYRKISMWSRMTKAGVGGVGPKHFKNQAKVNFCKYTLTVVMVSVAVTTNKPTNWQTAAA